MPSTNPRKRVLPETSPDPPAKRPALVQRVSRGVFEALDTLHNSGSTAEEAKTFLQNVDDSDESSESISSEDEFETVLSNRSRVAPADENDTEEEVNWEDAIPDNPGSNHDANGISHHRTEHKDLELTLSKPDMFSSLTEAAAAAGHKKGPTKIERFIRVQTHCIHVQYLLWHNTTRNAWLNDKETQLILVKGMSEGLKAEVDRWRKSCGIDPQKVNKPRTTENGKDWGSTASKLEPDVVDMSHGDPLLRLLKYVVAYWKKKFTVTVPGLRKQGYRSVRDRDSEIKAFARNPSNPQFGERIPSLEDFRRAARKCEGSRDLGAQLFTALLRGLGIQTRMVASLQPVGFGWTKVEDAKPKKVPRPPDAASSSKEPSKKNANGDIDEQEQMFKSPSKMRLITNRNKGTPSAPINIDDSTSELSDARSIYSNSDLSILGKSAPATPRSVKSKERLDKDLSYPIYWSEVLSPVTNTYYVVSTRTTPTIVTSPDQLQSFEPRGVIAEKAKQVICYVIAFDSDGSAKDVTVRYLKRHQLPGKTKGFRLPPEKVAIHNKRGKIVKYEEYDWFKRVMSLYARRKRTLADDIEEQGDLVPAKAVNSAKASGAETLQGYKNSAEFVLERHLRREEAILPAAKVVKHFTVGKGDKEKKEPVYRRKDVVTCKTVESWHKEGREIRMGEHPLKLVPIRAVTLIRKLEVEQATRNTGEKPLQGLYSKSQTDWIIPPPIKDGKIPRNAFGNIDVYVPSMVPNGAVHVPRGGTVRICKKLGIDFAEACIGFEFGSQRAVPILSGVVIAEENEGLVIDAWEEEQERKRVREDAKREKLLLGTWRKFALGLRIVERVKAEYGQGGEIPDAVNPFMNKRQRESARDLSDRKTPADHELADAEAANAGGFFHPGDNTADLGGGFLAEAEGDNGAPSELELHGSQSTLPQIGEHDQGVEGSKTRSAVAPAGVPRSLRASHQQAMHEESPDTAESETEANEEHPAFSTPKRGAKRGRHGSQQRAHVATRRVLRSALKATKKGSTSYTEGDSEGE